MATRYAAATREMIGWSAPRCDRSPDQARPGWLGTAQTIRGNCGDCRGCNLVKLTDLVRIRNTQSCVREAQNGGERGIPVERGGIDHHGIVGRTERGDGARGILLVAGSDVPLH